MLLSSAIDTDYYLTHTQSLDYIFPSMHAQRNHLNENPPATTKLYYANYASRAPVTHFHPTVEHIRGIGRNF